MHIKAPRLSEAQSGPEKTMAGLIQGMTYLFKTNRVVRLTEKDKLLKSKSGVKMNSRFSL